MKKKYGQFQTLWQFFCQNAPNNIYKTNSNHKVNALVTKQKKKKIRKMSTGYSNMSFTKKLLKPHEKTDPFIYLYLMKQ